ncbi:Rv0909 family putative TA system antitoxin [Rarobacter incanus]|uniref:Antitoxin protein of toxin-antitoxin system n=1 Tax=Rarobacter incanus TaxID=153494 RepID=A0A542SMN9_9MICO|nr:Rv0909 family putative TA system antitoxin [Rarobacter incanus]TQK75893.1 hypothetical protein FB389_0535 [Rarobacter incanus]
MVDFGELKNKAEGLLAQAKEQATDERIEQAADALKKVAPDNIDATIDSIADKAKDLNN